MCVCGGVHDSHASMSFIVSRIFEIKGEYDKNFGKWIMPSDEIIVFNSSLIALVEFQAVGMGKIIQMIWSYCYMHN